MDFDQATTKLRDLQRAFADPRRRKRVDMLFARIAIDPAPERIALLCDRVKQMDPYDKLPFLLSVDALCNELGIPQP